MNDPLNRWVIIFLLLVLVIVWNTIAGCAQVPECEKFTLHPATGPRGEQIFWASEENLIKMMVLIDGLHKGTCRLGE